GSVPPMPVPTENPITPEKRVLGKILFFEEQMSMSNTVACATCHTMGSAGADARPARNPGPDHLLNTPDGILGSSGVPHASASNDYVRDGTYQTGAQITPRSANPVINAAFGVELFWDGRARTIFNDPLSGAQQIGMWGAPENQSIGPPLSAVEMGHDGVAWA